MICPRCSQDKPLFARSLCRQCYRWLWDHEGLQTYPRKRKHSRDVAEDYEFIRATHGSSRADASGRMGISLDALESALRRAPRTPGVAPQGASESQ